MASFFDNLFGSSRAPRPVRRVGRARLSLEALEDRLVLTGTHALSEVPVLNSLPGAPATLYLDFNGDHSDSWSAVDFKKTFTPGDTPAFDLDGDPSTFNDEELGAIQSIWRRVAEAYSPFNINVTTVNPGSFDNYKAEKVVIGGSSQDWLKTDDAGKVIKPTGYSSIGSFTDDYPNVVYAFSADIIALSKDSNQFDVNHQAIQVVPAVANTISHEAGHSFGLRHHSVYDAKGDYAQNPNGDRTPYGFSDGISTPIMGGIADERTTWSNGPSTDGPTDFQDDMAIIAGKRNGFGYRPEDHSQDLWSADAMDDKGIQNVFHSWSTGIGVTTFHLFQGSGVIGTTEDRDTFQFTTSGGKTVIDVKTIGDGATLHATVELWKTDVFWAGGQPIYFKSLVASADPSDSLDAHLTQQLDAGTYQVVVGSHGRYGDVGQYTLQVGAETTDQFYSTATVPNIFMNLGDPPFLPVGDPYQINPGIERVGQLDLVATPLVSQVSNLPTTDVTQSSSQPAVFNDSFIAASSIAVTATIDQTTSAALANPSVAPALFSVGVSAF
jgi:serralysin